MSAWIVNRNHLDLLLTAALAWGLIDAEDANDIGRLLWKENLANVAYRYPDDHDGQRPGPQGFRDHDVDTYRFQPYPGRVDPEVVMTAAGSLIYQSSEHPGWTTSAAYHWIMRLSGQALARIPAYLAEHGPIDPSRQPQGRRSWYLPMTSDGQRHTYVGDGWSVPDRHVFLRVAALRAR